MSLDKAVLHRKEKREPYYDGDPRSFDTTCRNHGSCPSCRRNRTVSNQRRKADADAEWKSWINGEVDENEGEG